MSKQIRFYTTYNDEANLITRLQADAGCKIFLPNFTSRSELIEIALLEPIVPGREHQDPVLITNDSFISGLNIDQYGENYYRINEHKSPVIVWSRSSASPVCSYPGRFWVEDKKGKQKKSADFLSWVDNVFRLTKRMYNQKHASVAKCFIGPDFFVQLTAGALRVALDGETA